MRNASFKIWIAAFCLCSAAFVNKTMAQVTWNCGGFFNRKHKAQVTATPKLAPAREIQINKTDL